MLIPETEIIVTKDGVEILRKTVRPGEYVIGCEPECEVQIDVELVSRRHAQLTVNYDHVLIEDLSSSNGTFVNGQPVTGSTRLWPNQKIQIGAATIELRRVKTVPPPDVSLAPAQAAVRRLLPEEFLRDKKYDIGKVVAQGGMGAILDAQETTIERRVAMKVMLDGSSPDDLTRFVAEAKITGQLEHPNVVPVHELSVDENGQPFYTMKMVRGITLRKVLELLSEGAAETVKKYPLPALLTIFQKVCDALAFAHSKGVIHRDLKPENMMLDDFGVVLVMDWGLAKRMKDEGGRMKPSAPSAVGDENANARSAQDVSSFILPPSSFSAAATLAGTIMGTPQYMSPEQARGEVEDLDVRSDIYALGAILYHLLALRPPVTGRTAMEIVSKVAEGHVELLDLLPRHKDTKRMQGAGSFASSRLRGYLPGGRIPDSLAAVVRKAMAFERDQRYWTVEELQADLTAYQNGFATSAENAGLGKQLLLAFKRHKVAATGAFAVLIVGAVFGTKALVEGRRAEREAVRANAEAARANGTLSELKKTAPTLLALAGSEASFQRFDSALEKLDAALALDPGLTAARWRRVWLLLGMERYSEAAAAFRLAQQRDPAEHAHDQFLPVLDALAAAPDDATRFTPERTAAIYQQLDSVEASGELNALTKHLTLGAKQKYQLVRQRLDAWLGRNVGVVKVQSDGTIEVRDFPKTVDTLEQLRGLPISHLEISETKVKSLEPLRGMPLVKITFYHTLVTDISPLRGMRLTSYACSDLNVADLSPLAGMPLEELTASSTPVRDLSPLRGTPLQRLRLASCGIVDFSPLRGVPLRDLDIFNNQLADLSFLADAPIEKLNCPKNKISDLTPLRGRPLKFLNANENPIGDLSPLRGTPIVELHIQATPVKDFTPLLDLPKLEKLALDNRGKALEPLRLHPSLKYIALSGSAPYRPVAEFWKDYDAKQAAEKQ